MVKRASVHNVPLKPDFGPDDAAFPPLPEITSSVIRDQVFTHTSFYSGRPAQVFEDDPSDPQLNYEKYEHFGDTVLSLVVAEIVLERYPNLRVGPSSIIRHKVTQNSTLSQITFKYGLIDHLRGLDAAMNVLRISQKLQADLLESFIGGLYLDQGLPAVRAWLAPLFTPYIHAAYCLVREEYLRYTVKKPLHSMPASMLLARFPRRTSPPVPFYSSISYNSILKELRDKYRTSLITKLWWRDIMLKEPITTASASRHVWQAQLMFQKRVCAQANSSSKSRAHDKAARALMQRLGLGIYVYPAEADRKTRSARLGSAFLKMEVKTAPVMWRGRSVFPAHRRHQRVTELGYRFARTCFAWKGRIR